ncbi:hypothetical protein [Acidihalobacter prosperus]|uniref:NADH:quinone oxidoreductase/Mrp antiporter membrane subunit domain-containing protein n=1 Tax=Acidihalobacter prosperus TaxID=160660 RepID=A0A1A6C0J6_9GAMM|nr:hypothetical protein [Acidihalobacter prosperus]OBS08083.1 hypothetical protein Thpro_022333 [Acidihalobacter prosperus]
MTELTPRLVVALLFLPVFPFSALFVQLLGRRIKSAPIRAALFLLWPLVGVMLLGSDPALPHWLRVWVLLSALLYAVRLLATRDLRLWTAYLGASTYAMLWLLHPDSISGWLSAFGLGAPLALMALVGGALERRFGAAYGGLYGGLHLHQPRLAGGLTLATLAAVASPVFPGFFVLTGIALHSDPTIAAAIMAVWILWTWAAVVLMQSFMFGKPQSLPAVEDLAKPQLHVLVAALAALLLASVALLTTLLQGG